MKKVALAACVALSFAVVACEQQMETYTKGKAKAETVEAQINLPAIAGLQIAYKAMNQKYASTFAEAGYSMTGNSPVYSYFLANDIIKGDLGPAAIPDDLPMPANDDEFIIYAIANLDDDPDLDIWKTDQNRSLQHVKSDL